MNKLQGKDPFKFGIFPWVCFFGVGGGAPWLALSLFFFCWWWGGRVGGGVIMVDYF